MLVKRALGWMALGLAAVALAFPGAQGAKGDGVATNRNRTAEFHFVTSKTERQGNPVVEGTLRFQCTDPETVGGVRIQVPKVMRLAVDGNKATFAGPAGIRFQTKAGVKEARGQAVIKVADNRKPESKDGRPDVFSIQFRTEKSDVTYQFEGAVTRGDIVVGTRP